MFLPSFPAGISNNFQFFGPTFDATGNSPRGWRSWNKPAGINFIWALSVGGGGFGGNGAATAATARTGGGGGSSGCVSSVLIPAFLLPDVLWLWPGQGATQVSASAQPSQLCVLPSISTAIAVAPGGINGGIGSAGGTVSAGVPTNIAGLGILSNIANSAGGNAGANTGGAVSSVSRTSLFIPFTGGAGGGGSTAANSVIAGGNITASSNTFGPSMYPLISGGVAGVSGTTPGSPGGAGFNTGLSLQYLLNRGQEPFTFSGGSGGGAGGASNGGDGGRGAWGCGGGGGGAGAVGGTGGDGGDGFIIIGAW